MSEESRLDRIASLPREQRNAIIADIARRRGISIDEARRLIRASWEFTARPKQLQPPGDWTYWWIRAGRGFGKEACVETPVPTPEGWTRLGDIAAGDLVFDESGRLAPVTAVFDSVPTEAYRLWFSDGSHLDTGADHLWTTWDHRARKAFGRSRYEPRGEFPVEWPAWRARRLHVGREAVSYEDSPGPATRSTRAVVESLTHGSRGDLNHSIPVCGPLDLPERDLPIDPYLLGAWLGDGDSRTSSLTSGAELQTRLRELGVLRNKHVPDAYLRASAAQRLALLQGLMDTAGSADTSSVEFSNTNPRLVSAVVELARSLGQKPVAGEGRAMLDGRDCGPKWRVTWRPTIPVFRLERKASRVKALGEQALRNRHRMIVRAEPIDPKPMRCLTVASRHHLFLLGEAMIPTHNTLSGAQWAKERGMEEGRRRIGVVAPTLGDCRATCFEGVTGLLSVLPNDALHGGSREAAWNKSLLELTLANGTIYKGFTSEEPDRLRGPQHHFVWGEEVSSWKDANAKTEDAMDTTWSNLKLGLRLGDHPRAVLTSTPKSNRLTKHLVGLAADGTLVMVTGSSYENRDNLSESWWQVVVAPLEGTRTGRQEIEAEVLEDVEGALWTRAMIDAIRVPLPAGWQRDERLRREWAARMTKIAVGVDPNTTSGESADNAGIVVCGLGEDRLGYVMDDRSQVRGGPRAWAAAAVDAYHDWEADRIVAEVNNGGEMVELTIRGYDPTVPVKSVSASRGKRTRAEPVAALYVSDEEREKEATIRHLGAFPDLEDEMTTWTPSEESPGRMDALVWAFTELRVWRPPMRYGRGVVTVGEIPGVVEMGEGLLDG